MAVPKKKMSRSRTRRRKAQWKLNRTGASNCPQCHSPKLPHRACPNCGTYRGREIIDTE
ncbi:MAG TPA: 50S ribosomal protein L32 [Acidimicrobiia bacterium]|nr:50S ribosomal protein L32 [Acidimicrobiia bacterium]